MVLDFESSHSNSGNCSGNDEQSGSNGDGSNGGRSGDRRPAWPGWDGGNWFSVRVTTQLYSIELCHDLQDMGCGALNNIERANAQNAADPVYLDGMVWSASYALARPRALDIGPENRLEQAPERSPGANPSKRRNAAARRAETAQKTEPSRGRKRRV